MGGDATYVGGGGVKLYRDLWRQCAAMAITERLNEPPCRRCLHVGDDARWVVGVVGVGVDCHRRINSC